MKRKPKVGDEATTIVTKDRHVPTLMCVTEVREKTLTARSVHGGGEYVYYHDGRPFRGVSTGITFDKEKIAVAKARRAAAEEERAAKERERVALENDPCYALARKLTWGFLDDSETTQRWMKLGPERLNTIIGWLESEGVEL